jgi:GMP synthase (glutamine-hydrolysing)
MLDPHSQRILILDFGSQYTQLIARRVREAGVYCELHPYDISPEAIETFAPRGIILSGGPESVTPSETPRPPKSIFDMDVPILGICYGMNVLAAEFGGSVDASARREFGHAQVRVNGSSTAVRDCSITYKMVSVTVAYEPLMSG